MPDSSVIEIEETMEVAAPPERIWEVWEAVERWPEWTQSIGELRALDARPWGVGSRFAIRQPRLPRSVLTIEAWQPPRSFTWVSRSPGLEVIAGHQLVQTASGSQVRLFVQYRGFLGPIIGRLARRLTAQYVRMEAEGLKREAESRLSSA